jgi:hypothetical protein
MWLIVWIKHFHLSGWETVARDIRMTTIWCTAFCDVLWRSQYLHYRVIYMWWVGKDLKMKRSQPNRNTIPSFNWRDWRTPRNYPVTAAGVAAKIRTEPFPNTNPERGHNNIQRRRGLLLLLLPPLPLLLPLIIIIQFNSLFIYVLSSTAGGQLHSQHGIKKPNNNKTNETRHT